MALAVSGRGRLRWSAAIPGQLQDRQRVAVLYIGGLAYALLVHLRRLAGSGMALAITTGIAAAAWAYQLHPSA